MAEIIFWLATKVVPVTYVMTQSRANKNCLQHSSSWYFSLNSIAL